MTTIEKVTIRFSDGKEIELTKEQFEELKQSFQQNTWWTYPIWPRCPDYPIYPWVISTTGTYVCNKTLNTVTAYTTDTKDKTS